MPRRMLPISNFKFYLRHWGRRPERNLRDSFGKHIPSAFASTHPSATPRPDPKVSGTISSKPCTCKQKGYAHSPYSSRSRSSTLKWFATIGIIPRRPHDGLVFAAQLICFGIYRHNPVSISPKHVIEPFFTGLGRLQCGTVQVSIPCT
jgi:hypothetical protein